VLCLGHGAAYVNLRRELDKECLPLTRALTRPARSSGDEIRLRGKMGVIDHVRGGSWLVFLLRCPHDQSLLRGVAELL
jgi:hypothetical protein